MSKLFFGLSKIRTSCPLNIASGGNARKAVLAVAIFFLIPTSAFAETSVSNIKLKNMDSGAGTAKIQFDLANEAGGLHGDSALNNWVWVFAKYSKDPGAGSREWHAVTFATSGHTSGGTSEIKIADNNKGAFIRGSGTSVKLVFSCTAGDLTCAEAANAGFRVKVFAIDMIYVPGGVFSLGEDHKVYPGNDSKYGCPLFENYVCSGGPTCDRDGTPGTWTMSDAAFFKPGREDCYGVGVPTRQHVDIVSEGELTVGWVNNNGDFSFDTTGTLPDLIYNTEQGGGDGSGPLPAAFPKGYDAFFFMEHEMSQGQYRDFLNTLTRTQQNNRVISNTTGDTISNYYVLNNASSVTDRNGVRAPSSNNGTTAPVIFGCDLNGNGSFNEADDGEWVPVNHIGWDDMLAYADWAGLRPMSEFEFEKAARGTREAPYAQYVWANSYFDGSDIFYEPVGGVNLSESTGCGEGLAAPCLTGTGTVNELVTGWSDTISYNNIANYLTNPEQFVRSGAFVGDRTVTPEGPYGGYDLGGNLWERVISIGSADGRSFEGSHGDGELDANGDKTNTDWPAIAGMGFRGGAYTNESVRMRIGDRSHAALGYINPGAHNRGHRSLGQRFVRKATYAA